LAPPILRGDTPSEQPTERSHLAGSSAQIRPIPGDSQSFMVIACDSPQLGDLEAGDPIPAYRAVGRALRDLRAQREHHHPGFSFEAYNTWRNRFFVES